MGKKRLGSESVCLHVVDVQKSLMAKINRAEAVEQNIGLLIQCFKILKVPILSNTQYLKGLGPYLPSLQALVSDVPQFDKVTFSAAADPATMKHLSSPEAGSEDCCFGGC